MRTWDLALGFIPAIVCLIVAAGLRDLQLDMRRLFLLPAINSIAFFLVFAGVSLVTQNQLTTLPTRDVLVDAAANGVLFALLGEFIRVFIWLAGCAFFALSIQPTRRISISSIMLGIALIGVATAIALSFFP
jgi:hypothetical protein